MNFSPEVSADLDSVVVDASTATFAVTYTDLDDSVLFSTIDGNDVRVAGPNGFSQLAALVSVDQPGDGSSRTATYRITAPGGAWTPTDSGTYTAMMQANEVSDTSGNYVLSGTLDSFTVDVPGGPWQNTRNALDVNDDGTVTPQDVLIVINDLNARGIRNLDPPFPPNVPPPYIDVTGDSLVGPQDVLVIINYLNSLPPGPGAAGDPIPRSSPGDVAANSILVKYTYYGDADLSGVVDGTDYALADNGFNAVLSGWFNGDFDYTNLVDGTDYALIDNAFNSHGGPLAGNGPAGLGPIPRAADGADAFRSRSDRSTLRGPDYLDDDGRGLFDASILDNELLDALANGGRRRSRTTPAG